MRRLRYEWHYLKVVAFVSDTACRIERLSQRVLATPHLRRFTWDASSAVLSLNEQQPREQEETMTVSTTTLSIRQLTPVFGAEITGVDLRDLDEAVTSPTTSR
jgi:hypothetical protein